VAFADLAHADRRTNLAPLDAGLVRMYHHGRVAQGSGFDRVLVCEVGADE
jgi:hypothetical protein